MHLCRQENKSIKRRGAGLFLASLIASLSCLVPVGPATAQSLKALQEMTGDVPAKSGQGEAPKASGRGKMYKGYLVRQSAMNHGSLTMYICPGRWALKCAFVTIIVDEPKDRVIAYTRQTNKYLIDTLKVGRGRFNGFRRGGDFHWGKYTTVGHEKWQGLPVTIMERKGTRTDLKTKTDVVITEQQLNCSVIKLSKTLEDIGYALFDTDYQYGLPLRVSRTAHSRNPHYCTIRPVVTLETSIFKESSFPEREFDVPAGLTRVKSEIDLFSNDTGDFGGDSSTKTRLRFRENQIHLQPK